METRYASGPDGYLSYDTKKLREEFLIESVFEPDKIKLTYSHFDRIIAGGAMPSGNVLNLTAGSELACEYFLERREMGVINIGGPGEIMADGTAYDMKKSDCLYIGRGTRDVVFKSRGSDLPAQFYINSCPAHRGCPTVYIPYEKAERVRLGTLAECNRRTISKYILPGVTESCQLVMGVTALEEGSNWNTFPTHTHERRMEVYLYFDISENSAVFHLMGEPRNTRHIVVKDRQAVISPSWSIHSGVGTRNYSFIWGMCGENQDFDDMQGVNTLSLR